MRRRSMRDQGGGGKRGGFLQSNLDNSSLTLSASTGDDRLSSEAICRRQKCGSPFFLGASLSRSQSIEPLADRAWEAIRRSSRNFVPRHLRHLRDRSREQGKGSWQVTTEHPEDVSGAVSVSVERGLKRHLKWLLGLHHCVTVQMVMHVRSPGAAGCIAHCSLGSGTCKLRESVSGRSAREA